MGASELPRSACAAAIALVLVAGAACSRVDRVGQSAVAASPTTTTSTSTTVPPTTTAAPTTTALPIPPGLARGAEGPEVQLLEQRLADLRFDSGKVDGVFDAATQHAVMGFQKLHGLPRTGRATDDVVARLSVVGDPPPLLPDGGPSRVEIDLPRQVLLLWKDGALVRITSISTGNNKRYCVEGECAVAVTPGGSFRVNRKIRGKRVSRLGTLFNPLYFNGGIAIHGAASVPSYPASHGCVRIPMHTSAWFYDTVGSGTPVYVVGGKRAAVPFNEQAPGDTSATTTTTVPATTTTTSSVPPETPTTAPTSTSTTSTTSTTTTLL